eukprot:jgi/Mesvir1/17152/Mv07578-RA.1
MYDHRSSPEPESPASTTRSTLAMLPRVPRHSMSPTLASTQRWGLPPPAAELKRTRSYSGPPPKLTPPTHSNPSMRVSSLSKSKAEPFGPLPDLPAVRTSLDISPASPTASAPRSRRPSMQMSPTGALARANSLGQALVNAKEEAALTLPTNLEVSYQKYLRTCVGLQNGYLSLALGTLLLLASALVHVFVLYDSFSCAGAAMHLAFVLSVIAAGALLVPLRRWWLRRRNSGSVHGDGSSHGRRSGSVHGDGSSHGRRSVSVHGDGSSHRRNSPTVILNLPPILEPSVIGTATCCLLMIGQTVWSLLDPYCGFETSPAGQITGMDGSSGVTSVGIAAYDALVGGAGGGSNGEATGGTFHSVYRGLSTGALVTGELATLTLWLCTCTITLHAFVYLNLILSSVAATTAVLCFLSFALASLGSMGGPWEDRATLAGSHLLPCAFFLLACQLALLHVAWWRRSIVLSSYRMYLSSRKIAEQAVRKSFTLAINLIKSQRQNSDLKEMLARATSPKCLDDVLDMATPLTKVRHLLTQSMVEVDVPASIVDTIKSVLGLIETMGISDLRTPVGLVDFAAMQGLDPETTRWLECNLLTPKANASGREGNSGTADGHTVAATARKASRIAASRRHESENGINASDEGSFSPADREEEGGNIKGNGGLGNKAPSWMAEDAPQMLSAFPSSLPLDRSVSEGPELLSASGRAADVLGPRIGTHSSGPRLTVTNIDLDLVGGGAILTATPVALEAAGPTRESPALIPRDDSGHGGGGSVLGSHDTADVTASSAMPPSSKDSGSAAARPGATPGSKGASKDGDRGPAGIADKPGVEAVRAIGAMGAMGAGRAVQAHPPRVFLPRWRPPQVLGRSPVVQQTIPTMRPPPARQALRAGRAGGTSAMH